MDGNLDSLYIADTLKSRIIQYLTQDLKSLNIECISLFGSRIHMLTKGGYNSDLDICAYTKCLTYANIPHLIKVINAFGGDFHDKPPRFIADSIIQRIEWYITIENVILDVNLVYYDESFINSAVFDPVHDSYDVILGAMYLNANVIYGTHPYDSFRAQIVPFYSEPIRKYRSRVLAERVVKFYKRVEDTLNENQDNILYYLYKERYYFVKLIFITRKIYPVDYDRNLYKQLMGIDGISNDDANVISFIEKCSIEELAIKLLKIIDNQFDYIRRIEPDLLP